MDGDRLAANWGSRCSAAYRRVAACVERGLLERLALLRDEPSLIRASREGLRYAGLGGLRVAVISPGAVEHWLRCASTALTLEAEFAGRVISERELVFAEQLEGRPLASAKLGELPGGGPRLHRPDLVGPLRRARDCDRCRVVPEGAARHAEPRRPARRPARRWHRHPDRAGLEHNVAYVVAHRIADPDSAERLARVAGTEPTWATTQRIDGAAFALPRGEGTRTRQRDFIVGPDQFKRLRTGEAVRINHKAKRPAQVVRVWAPQAARVRAELP